MLITTCSSGWICGSAFSLRKRRSSASEAQRYWVGFSPMREKTRRQALTSGSSDSDPVASRDRAVAWNASTVPSTEASLAMPSVHSTPGTSSGKLFQISSEWRKCMAPPDATFAVAFGTMYGIAPQSPLR